MGKCIQHIGKFVEPIPTDRSVKEVMSVQCQKHRVTKISMPSQVLTKAAECARIEFKHSKLLHAQN